MIKKYGSKILTSVSFTGIVISNIKASNTGDVTIKIGGKTYTKSGSKLTKASKLPKIILGEIGSKFGNSLKDSDGNTIDLTGADKKYFIKEIKEIGNAPSGVIKFDTTSGTCNIETTNPISIELVKKEDVLEIVYDNACKKKT